MVEIVPTTIEHIRQLNETIREKDKREALRLGVDPLKALFQSYKYAIIRHTVLIDQEVAAIFGVTGNLFSNQNTIFLITGEPVYKIPSITFVRLYIQELEKLLSIFQKLICYVDAQYEEAIKLIELVGFEREQTVMLNDNKFYIYGLSN